MDPNEMPRVSTRSRIVIRRFSSTNFWISLMFWSLIDVEGRPGRSSSSTRSRPSLNNLYQSKALARDIHFSPKAFCNILNVSVALIPFLKQNLTQLLCSTNSTNRHKNFQRCKQTSVIKQLHKILT